MSERNRPKYYTLYNLIYMKFKTGRTKLRYLRLYAQQKHEAKHSKEVDYNKRKAFD